MILLALRTNSLKPGLNRDRAFFVLPKRLSATGVHVIPQITDSKGLMPEFFSPGQ